MNGQKMNNEVEKLTSEILKLNEQIDELGRLPVRIILECGEKLKEQRKLLKHGTWEKWCRETYQDRLSITTIKRRIRVFDWYFVNRSTVTDLTKLTVDELYVLAGIIKVDRDEENIPKDDKKFPGTPSEKKTNERTPFEKFHSLLSRVQDITDETFSGDETSKLVKCGQVFVEWFTDNGGQVPIKPVAVEMEDAA